MRTSTRFLFLLALGAALLGCPTPAEAPWQIVTEGQSSALLSISGSSASDVFAVGADHGSGPLVLHYDGTSWTSLDAGVRSVDLWWVHSLGPNQALMGGARGAILRYDAGTFTRMATPGYANQTVFGIWARSSTEAWAVGAVSGRSGFIWRWDGTAWTELSLPRDLQLDAQGEVPGLFKVWGDDDEVWVVGNAGAILHSTDGTTFEVVPSGTTDRLFTVAGNGDLLCAVGGASTGRLLELTGPTAPVNDRTPALSGLLQGIAVRGTSAWASGAAGTVFERQNGAWTEIDHGLPIDVASLHAIWIDPDGGIWAVGGGVLSAALDNGTIIHRGPEVPAYDPTPPAPDAGPDGSAPVPTCPAAAIDPEPDASIARRWNEQILNAIRRDIPRPTVHARNLFHLSAAMWDAWAAYDTTADGYFVRERHSATDIEAAREEAISYAAYRVLAHRYAPALSAGGPVSEVCFSEFMNVLGYDPENTDTTGDTPSALGNRIGAAIIAFGATDGANEAMNYADTTMWMPTNEALLVDQPTITVVDPSIWQQLNLATSVAQNGIPLNSGTQPYIGAHWREVTPFAMTRPGAGLPYYSLGEPPAFGPAIMPDVVEVIRRSAELDPALPATIDTSPASTGDNALGANDGDGYDVNPATGAPYTPHTVPLGDFGRVLAEFWADGPRSETPPGHWNTLANYVADHPMHQRLWEGSGTELDALEWDVRVYLALNGAVHDAAIAAWEIKRIYSYARPLTLIRYMASLGQSTDPSGPSYNANGLPLTTDLIEVITAESSAPGQRHEHLAAYVGEIAIRSWRGEPGDRRTQVGGSGWIRGVLWMPYQLRTFVTPAFPGFISGHSTFSRAAAEVLTRINGSAYFPGGLGEFVASPGMYSTFEVGPSTEVRLQWATYYDAADQAGQSRIWGGIHISADDFVGRRTGAAIGTAAYDLALTYIDGSAIP